MCRSINNRNNLHLNMHAKVGNSERKLTWVNTKEYDVKSFQFRTATVNCTDVQLKN